MKCTTNITFHLLVASLMLMACQKDNEPTPTPQPSYLPIFYKGDTLVHDNTIRYDTSRITIDSASSAGFNLTSSHNYIPGDYNVYFFRIEYDFEEPVRFLDSLAYGGAVFAGPILSTYAPGDTISTSIGDEAIHAWFPKIETQVNNTGWLKYHIWAHGGNTMQNVELGENYFVFKFGTPGDERLGWLNIVYQDTLCYVKEGYYWSEPNEEIVVGKK